MKLMRLYLILGVFSVGLIGCLDCVKGSGNQVEETRPVGDFVHIRLDVPGTITVSKGQTKKLTIQTDDNIIKKIKTEVHGSTLVIESTDPNRCLEPSKMSLSVSQSQMGQLEINGAGQILINDGFEADSVVLKIDGSGQIVTQEMITAASVEAHLDGTGQIRGIVNCESLTSNVDGTGHITWFGTAQTHHIAIDGAGQIDATDLETDETTVSINGDGVCDVNVIENLQVEINGNGKVFYAGSPNVTQSINGNGSVSQLNEL